MSYLWHEQLIHVIFPPSQEELLFIDYLNSLPDITQSESPEDWILSCIPYPKKIVQDGIRCLKNRRSRPIARAMAQIMAKKLRQSLPHYTSKKILLIPIPISSQRKHSRGFNQAFLLAKEIQKQVPQTICEPSYLIKIKETQKQALVQKREERFLNVLNCFYVPDFLQKKQGEYTVVLIDDIVTTGATLTEARKALVNAGINTKSIFALTFAY